MKATTNYGLKKPEANDAFDKSNDNENMDIIDAQMKANADAAVAVQAAADAEIMDLAGMGRTIETVKGNADALAIHESRITTNEAEISSQDVRLTAVEDQFVKDQSGIVTLSHGIQKVTTGQDTTLSNIKIPGRTLVNLLGNDGNCEDISKFVPVGASTISLNTSDKLYGNSSLEGTSSNSGESRTFSLSPCKIKASAYYIVIAEMKPMVALNHNMLIRQNNSSGTQIGADLSTSLAVTNGIWNVIYKKFQSDGSADSISLIGKCFTVNEKHLVDGMRVYEISQAEYNAIDTMTVEQIAVKYPYVDNMKSLNGTYIKRHGKNELPPFSEWNLHANSSMLGPYELEFTADGTYHESSVDITLIPNQRYYLVGTPTFIRHYDSFGEVINQVGGPTFIVPSNAVRQKAIIGVINESITISNPMLNLGSTALPFEPQNDDYLYFIDENLSSSVDGSVQDELYQVDASTYRKTKRFEHLTLDDSLGWSFNADDTGYKEVWLSMSTYLPGWDGDNNKMSVVKYDGRILTRGSATTGPDRFGNNSTIFIMTISDADSGWGESYAPSAAEIRAYFHGWKMNNGTFGTNYDGTGTKTWIPWGNSDNTNAVTTVPTTPSSAITSGKYDYYRLQYQLAESQDTPLNHEGSISLFDGDNVVEVGEGVVVRDAAKPVLRTSDNLWFIARHLEYPISDLKHRNLKMISAYKNNELDNSWKFQPSPNAQGYEFAYITNDDYDPTASYAITYISQPYQVSSSVVSLVGKYQTNLKTVIAHNTQNIAEVSSKVSMIANAYAKKDQGQIIKPTLLNGWTYAHGGYWKDEFGLVNVQLVIYNGTATFDTVLFILPAGYRVANGYNLHFNVTSSTTGIPTASTDFVNGIVRIESNGSVKIRQGSNGFLGLNFSFRAEQ